MPPAPYPDFRWFFRTVRVLPVVAIAALGGGIIGGFSIFAINLALTAPPNHSVPPEPGSKLASETTKASADAPAAPMRTFDVATPAAAPVAAVATAPASPAPPSAAPVQTTAASAAVSNSNLPPVVELAPVSAQDISNSSPAQPALAAMTPAQAGEINGAITIVHPPTTAASEQPSPTPAAPQLTVTPPQQQTSWPDALSREHKAGGRPQAPTERASERASGNVRPLYDYSRQDDQNADHDADRAVVDGHVRAKYSEKNAAKSAKTKSRMKPQYAVRNAPPLDLERSSERADERSYDRSDERDDEDGGNALPAQPAPPPLPFFGLFGGGDRD